MKISILGCGWLGLPAGRLFLEKGDTVLGSTTRRERLPLLSRHGIEPHLVRLNEPLDSDRLAPFWHSDLLILNVPPGRSRSDVRTRHPSEIAALLEEISDKGIDWIVFASSTSVYGGSGIKRESDAGTEPAGSESGEALLECERMLIDHPRFDTTIIRFGGLYGYDRHPAKNLAGREGLGGGGKPVNLIHRDDCLGILERIVSRNIRNEVFNAVSDAHPSRHAFYTAMAASMGMEPPRFADLGGEDGKIVSNEKLKKALGYRFLYPDPQQPSP